MKAKLLRGVGKFLEGALRMEKCDACAEPIRKEEHGITRPVKTVGEAQPEYKRFHESCWMGP